MSDSPAQALQRAIAWLWYEMGNPYNWLVAVLLASSLYTVIAGCGR